MLLEFSRDVLVGDPAARVEIAVVRLHLAEAMLARMSVELPAVCDLYIGLGHKIMSTLVPRAVGGFRVVIPVAFGAKRDV